MGTHVTQHFYMFLERLFYVVFGLNFLQSCILRRFFLLQVKARVSGPKSVKKGHYTLFDSIYGVHPQLILFQPKF